MNRICKSGLKTSPDFFGRYRDTFDTPRRSKKVVRCAGIRLSAERWEDVIPEIRELLTKSGETFRATNSDGIRFTVDVGFLDFPEMDAWLQEKGAFSIVIPADFWSVLAPFSCNFVFTFFCSPPEQAPEILGADEETQILLESRWFREPFSRKGQLTKGFLSIRRLNDEKFPIFSDVWKRADGEYRLPFPERLDWCDVGKTVQRTLVEWEPLFLEMKNSGAELELSITIPREEQAKFLRSQFGVESDGIQRLHRLEIPLKFTIAADSQQYVNRKNEGA
ncbi:MAG: hypothetical protein Q4D98_14500 [Planctomycetia bacterium]|nr:hypothetical protein [Planctomycetia bacterium]